METTRPATVSTSDTAPSLPAAATSPVSRRTFLRAAEGVLLARGVVPLLASGAAGSLIADVAPARSAAAAAPRITMGGVLNVAIGTNISSLEPQVTTRGGASPGKTYAGKYTPNRNESIMDSDLPPFGSDRSPAANSRLD